MDQGPMDETIELAEDRFISLTFERQWPKYVAHWSIRQRSGDADFPLASGVLDALPSRATPGSETIWAGLREQAHTDAQQAAASIEAATPHRRSLLSRLFGHRDER